MICQGCQGSFLYRYFKSGSKTYPLCRQCRAVQRQLDREAKQNRPKASKTCACGARISRGTASGRCWRCAQEIVNQRHHIKSLERRAAKVARGEGQADILHVQRSPQYYKLQQRALAEPERYLEFTHGEWWLKEFHCQGCKKWIITSGQCFACATGRPRQYDCLPQAERQTPVELRSGPDDQERRAS